jgi:hypothetical protein
MTSDQRPVHQAAQLCHYCDAKLRRRERFAKLLAAWQHLEGCTDLAAYFRLEEDDNIPAEVDEVRIADYVWDELEDAEAAFRHELEHFNAEHQAAVDAISEDGRLA